MLADVVGREGAQRRDRPPALAQVGQHARHQAVGHALTSEPGVGLDVGHHDDVAPQAVVGDRDDVVVDHQLVSLSFGVVAHRVLHIRSVPPKAAPGAALTP